MLDQSGHVLATAKVVKNIFEIPDNVNQVAVKVVFKNRAGKTVLVDQATPPRCTTGGTIPDHAPDV